MIDYGFISHFLSEPSDARAIVLSFVATWAVSDANHKGLISMISACVGTAVVLLLSPDAWGERIGLALAVGFSAPFIYKYGMRAAFHYLPWLGDKS